MDCDSLVECGEFFAAGFYRDPDAPPVIRMAQAIACHLDHIELPPWQGRLLYPAEREGEDPGHLYAGSAVHFRYNVPLTWDPGLQQQKIAEAQGPHKEALVELQAAMEQFPGFTQLDGWIHSSANFRRILAEGLNAYEARIKAAMAAEAVLSERSDGSVRSVRSVGSPEKLAFYKAMQITVDAIRGLHARIVAMLEEGSADDEPGEAARMALLEALRLVPFEPATTFYEAMVCENFVYYLDCCDGLGRFDQDLFPYYRADLDAGRTSRAEALALVEELWNSMDAHWGWNVAIGGTAPDGEPGASELTDVCLEAARNMGRAHPNLALRLREDTPVETWHEAFKTLATGIGQPALYSEENYLRAIRGIQLGVTEEDLPDFAFGGCTELIVHGKSCCGGADTHFNLPKVLHESIHDHLAACETFDQFFDKFAADLESAAHEAAEHTNREYRKLAEWQPQPIRSLFTDDCIDRGVDYHAGGARYNWSVVSVGGIANAADSLQALREVVFDGKEIAPAEMVEILRKNFEGHEDVRLRVQQCARFGNDDERVDALAARVAELTFRKFLSLRCERGGRFVPGCVMLEWYVWWGDGVGALPDGRLADEPIADSAGPYQGRDRSGPTAMLTSVARLPQHLAPGTLVLNARFSKNLFRDQESMAKLRTLVQTYFRMGGLQLQVNVIDQETLIKAMEHPESYAGLIVRIGGYSAYWRNLTESARLAVLQRSEHA